MSLMNIDLITYFSGICSQCDFCFALFCRPVAENEISYLGMTNPVYAVYDEEQDSGPYETFGIMKSHYAPSVSSDVPSLSSSYPPSETGAYSLSYIVPSRTGSRPPSVADSSDIYASIRSSQMDPYTDFPRESRSKKTKHRK